MSFMHYLSLTKKVNIYVLSDGDINLTLYPYSLSELKKRRKEHHPFLVFKEDDKYYVADIPANLNFVIDEEVHLCAQNCKRCSALPDDKGGCAKVRNRRVNCIENYPCITRGYETVHTKHESFVVLVCSNYHKWQRKRPSIEKRIQSKIGLAQFLWDDVDDFSDISRRTRHMDTGHYARLIDLLK